MNNKKIAVIGVGNMGGAIVTGLIKSEFIAKSDIFVFDTRESILAEMKEAGVTIAGHSLDAARNSDVIIIAVKPRFVGKVLHEIKPALIPGKILISIAAGISLSDLAGICGDDIACYRVMPNTAVAMQQSLTCISGNEAGRSDLDYVMELFNNLGRTVEIREDLMPAATVLSSCGIAFALRYIRAAVEGGVEMGFGAEEAGLITAQTVKGAAELILSSGNHPESEIDKVTTPGGITIAGLNEMEHEGFSSSLIKGIMAAYKKVENK
ncbi:MAG: pyrroline-5-carboxylate reductase [Prolixibacteraceae bacterium]|nr:pyrroline-5-carboxylate reductase [Prolixibacteraceae bacterium]